MVPGGGYRIDISKHLWLMILTNVYFFYSFAGFYYVAITESTGGDPATMTGFYFHPYSEPCVVSMLFASFFFDPFHR